MSVEPRYITALSPQQWREILAVLGTGDFTAISFRPPREDEAHLGKINGIDRYWWVCETEYQVITKHDEGVVEEMHVQRRVLPFQITLPYDDVD